MRVRWIGFGVSMILALAGCGGEDEAVEVQSPTTRAEVEREVRLASAGIAERSDSVRAKMEEVPALTGEERRDLRRDVNREQVAVARSLGVRASGESEMERLRREGKLVPLEDTTHYWIVRELEHSVPWVTPDARAMLHEIGERFHARLDSLGLPGYRMEVTSVLRTAASQADLRGTNPNAASGVSAHEFGTTLDVSHVRFAPPARSALSARVPSAPQLTPRVREVEAAQLAEVAEEHAHALQAELGRVLREMRDEGKLKVMMERRQPVYHMTVSQQLAETRGSD